MCKVFVDPHRKKQSGYVMTTHDLVGTSGSGRGVLCVERGKARVAEEAHPCASTGHYGGLRGRGKERGHSPAKGLRGRPRTVRCMCVRWKYGQAYSYAWNPQLKRESTEGMKRSQGLMQEAAAMAKSIWQDAEQKALWLERYKEAPGKYKSAWMMLVGVCVEKLKTEAAEERGLCGQRPNEDRGDKTEDTKVLRTLGCDRLVSLNVPIKMKGYRWRSMRAARSVQMQV